MKTKCNYILRLPATFLFMLLTAITAVSSPRTVSGQIIDSDDGEPVPYSSIYIDGTTKGTLSDENGKFTIVVDGDTITLRVTAMGFNKETVSIKPGKGFIKIKIKPIGVSVGEVIVKPQKQKYSKKNNPAVDLSRRIANNRKLFDPRKNPYYNREKYERYSLGFNDLDSTGSNNFFIRKFKFLKDYIDTSDVTGKKVLILSVREQASNQYYRNDPERDVEIIKGINSVGADDFLDQESMSTLLDDFLSDVNIFANDVSLMHKRFVSPFSPIAPDFYRFYITDTISVDSVKYVELSFVPRNSQSYGFTGKIYVAANDPSTFIKKVTLNVPKDINLNYVDRLYISQDYERGPDSCLLKVNEDITGELQMFPGLPAIYAKKRAIYGNFSFDAPTNEEKIFSMAGKVDESDAVGMRDSTFWSKVRYTPLTDKEQKTGQMMKRLRSNSLYYWAEKILKIATTGYIHFSDNSKIDFGPLTSIFSHNELEGYRFRAGAMTTANLCKRFFAKGYVAYGTRDKKWKYMGEVEYSFNNKKYSPREFPVNSIRAIYQYDIDMLGQHLANKDNDNMFLSIRRHKDYQITYLRKIGGEYYHEYRNGLSFGAGAYTQRQYSTEFMPFAYTDGRNFRHYDETMLKVILRFAPGEKLFQNGDKRRTIAHSAPVLTISHEFAPSGMFGNKTPINRTEISFLKRFWFSAFGYIDLLAKGGHIWNRVNYPDMFIPSANLSYTIQPESYSLLNAMEFINDSYASIDLTYWGQGVLFNYIPLVKKLKLREVVEYKAMWGHLSSKNDPMRNGMNHVFDFPAISHVQRMTNRPYMEISAGLDNIFRLFRLDYVWRLNYRNAPGINKHGIRFGVHITF